METYWVDEACFINVLPNGKVYINDCLYPHTARHIIIPFLRNYLNKTYIDGLIISHYHYNHHGGVAHLIDGMKGQIGAIYSNGVYSTGNPETTYPEDTHWQNEMLGKISKYDIPHSYVKKDDYIWEGDVRIEFLAPLSQYANPSRTETDTPNDASMVLTRYVYGEYKFLFVGDIPLEPMKEVINNTSDIESTVFQITHHGDGSWIDEEILSAVNPELCLVERNRKNVLDVIGNRDYHLLGTDPRNRLKIVANSDGTFRKSTSVPETVPFSRGV